MSDDSMKRAVLEYRLEHFDVQVKESDWNEGEILLSVSTNGSHYTSIGLLPHEALKVLSALAAFLAKKGNKPE